MVFCLGKDMKNWRNSLVFVLVLQSKERDPDRNLLLSSVSLKLNLFTVKYIFVLLDIVPFAVLKGPTQVLKIFNMLYI
jgi:hypothetical protein